MLQWGLSALFAFLLCSAVNAAQVTQSTQQDIVPFPQEANAAKPAAIPSPVAQPPVTQPPVTQPPVTQPPVTQPPVAPLSGPQPQIVKPADVNPSVNQVNKTVPAVAPQNETTVVDLLPHRATYSIALDKNYYDEDIENAKGQMTIQLAQAGDGWAIEQKSTLHIYYKDGTAEQVITSLATYESLDGLKYNFNARTLRGDQEETISGDAILASKGGAGIVTYQQPDESTIQLPVGTIFPTQHLIYMLQAAMRGQKVVSNIVFDGSSETHEPVQVNTILGASQDPKLALTNKDLLHAKKAWPMRMAVYAVDSPSAEADYEISQHVLDRGVIRDMTLDYGTFKVKAVLVEIVVFS